MKEYIFDESIFWKNREKLIDKVITTQTQLLVQPLIFRFDITKEKRIMIWYSANSLPKKYKDQSQLVLGYPDYFYNNIQVDEHWVWNKSNAVYIRKLTSKKAVIKGSMLFYGPSLKQNTSPKVDVLLFDVTPPNSMPENNILNEKYVSSFIAEIVQVVEELKDFRQLEIGLKSKRETVNFHSKIYLEMLEQYFNSGRITKINHMENIYDLIINAKIVFAYPFTSPIFIAKELGVDCAFYSSSSLLENQTSYYGIKFINNQFALRKFLVRNVLRIL
jgi:polysaccharide biosynthesis PFTS motif protein